ncbi:MAG: hypothetical protein JNL30_00060 [Rubrivivax sp.]|nr:hypothetical protein [Rubrivivax sp.]
MCGRAELTAEEGHGGAITLFQRFGSAANPNIQRHCLGQTQLIGQRLPLRRR